MTLLSVYKLVCIIFPILLIEGFFSGSEIALLSADKLTLKELSKKGHTGAALALELANHPERVLSTTLLITNFCVITISAFIALYFLETVSNYSDLKAILVTSPLVVFFGELIPKTIYQRNATSFAPWVAYPVLWTYWLFFPITRLLASYTTRLSRMIKPIEELLSGKRKSTRDDIRALLSYTRKETEIKMSEKRMIKRIFDFQYSEAKHALIPLVQVDAVEDTATVQKALEKFQQHRHSRMPIFSSRIDNIIGILEVVDLLTATDLQQSIRHYLSPAHYVAETQSLEDLMLQMRREDNEMLVVVDEHGGAIGVLTFEDIVEEIVGEINDEYDFESPPYKALSEHSWSVQAKMEIQQINENLHLELPQGDYETLSGFLLQQFGRIPEPRDELFFDTPTGSYNFTIHKATERHIEVVLIHRIETQQKD
jgi:CBS domain containing-hemolysin-like protein